MLCQPCQPRLAARVPKRAVDEACTYTIHIYTYTTKQVRLALPILVYAYYTTHQVRLALPGLQPLASVSFVTWGDVPRPLDVYAIAAHAHEEVRSRE